MNWCWLLLKMLYQIVCCFVNLISLLFNIFWFCCNLAAATIPWCTLTLLGICVVSKFIKLRGPDDKQLITLLGTSTSALDDLTYWPIAHRGAGYDAPENSKAALKKCVSRGYRKVLLDASVTACGEIVIANRILLERAGLSGGIGCYTLNELKKINITELHPMGSQFEVEHIYSLNELAQFVSEYQMRLTICLYIHDTSALMLEKLIKFMTAHEDFTKRSIIISQSPILIYQLRKHQPNLICGLWQEKAISLTILKASTLFTSIYGAIFRNIIAPVIGISIIFLNKEEFNLHIAELWRNVGVRPIVYNVNSPNEKRYFQKTLKMQYLTDSLRSEPHLLIKA